MKLMKIAKILGLCLLSCIFSACPEQSEKYITLVNKSERDIVYQEYRDRNNRHFWARGYYCETVGNVNEETIKQYIQEQYERDRLEGDSEK
jgi:REP element-mobilizing transposase RayT